MADRTPGSADWPESPSGGATNAQTETQALTIDAPAVNPAHDAQARFVEQQWVDVEKSGIGAVHPLSINRDSQNVTDDPYTT